jgi:ABC-type multidrug transport system, ATPase and permease components
MFLLIVNTVASLALPAIMSSIVNVGINGGDMDYIIKYSLVMLAIATAGFVAYIGAGKIGARIVSFFSTELSGKIFKKTLSLSYTEFSNIGASALLTRSTEDIYMIREMVMSLIGTVAMVPTLLIGGLILSFKEDVMLSLVLFALIPVLLILVRVVGKRIVPRWEVADKFIDDQNQIVRERLNGIRVIRAYNKEPYEHARLTKSTDDMAENIIKANTMSGLLNPISMLVLNVATVLIAYIGAVRLQLNGTITAGSIIAVIQYVGLVMSALGEVFFLLVFLPKIRVSCNRMNEVLELPEKEEPNDDLNVEIKGNIEFKDVSFTYNGADEPAISGINLNIAAGQTAAFIGGTGAGKSTVLDLLLKFYNNTEGKIVVDGMNLSIFPQSVSATVFRWLCRRASS